MKTTESTTATPKITYEVSRMASGYCHAVRWTEWPTLLDGRYPNVDATGLGAFDRLSDAMQACEVDATQLGLDHSEISICH